MGVTRNILGIMGGMGPMASAEFVKTIYECNFSDREQNLPIVMLYSDPTIIDRTEALLNGSRAILLGQLTEALEQLYRLGASNIVICCVTSHYLLPELPIHLRERITSLLDVIFERVAESDKRHLLFCTDGTRRSRIFESHRDWETVKNKIVLPDETDQSDIHNIIYSIKRGSPVSDHVEQVEALLHKYGLDSFIAGCTEIHLLAKHLLFSSYKRAGCSCIDPLTIIARGLGLNSPFAAQREAYEIR